MNEPLLRSVLRLYTLFAGSDGLVEDEKRRISGFLDAHLGTDDVLHFIALLEEWSVACQANFHSEGWLEKELHKIAGTVNRELHQTQRYYLFLELLELCMADGSMSSQEDSLLTRFGEMINLPAGHMQSLRRFALASDVFSRPSENILLIEGGDESESISGSSWKIPGFKGSLAVLKVPDLDSYFVQFQGEIEPLLNGQRLPNGISRIWAPGATIRQPGCPPIFFSPMQERFVRPASRPQIDFQVNNISFVFPDGRTGLKDISLSEKGGRMIAIMGGSGCGKSTLLNVLNGNEKPSGGNVLINGTDLHRDGEKLEGLIGYIPQDDLLNERLTVYQNLYYAARFSFGNMPEEQINERCSRILDSLGLAATRDKEVGSPSKKTISGGQRKRLNIGLELIREPWVLFVDEPTSGLSSSDSLRTMELLKNLALDGKLVFVIIHQPSEEIFRMFDRLLVMDTGGIPVFYGNPLEAVSYFRREALLPNLKDATESANASEIFNIIETKLVQEDGYLSEQRKFSPQDWEGRFRRNFSLSQKGESEQKAIPEPVTKPGFFTQAKLYFTRDVLSKLHDQQYLLINLLEAPLLALLLALFVRYSPIKGLLGATGYSFAANENIPAYFFMSVIVAIFMGMSVSAEEIIRDRLLLKRERFLHLNRDAYLISKVALLFGLSILHTLSFVLISDWVLEVPYTGLEFWMVLFSASACANLLGLILSDTFRNAVVVYILIPLLLIPQIILGGALVRYDRLSPFFQGQDKVPLIGDMIVARWAYEAIMVAQFKNNPYQSRVFETEVAKEEAHYRRSAYIPALEQILADVTEEAKNQPAEGIRQRRKILLAELEKELSKFGQNASGFSFLGTDAPVSGVQQQSIRKVFAALLSHYNRIFLQQQAELDKIFAAAGTDSSGRNRLSIIRDEMENEQIARYLAEDFVLQPRLELTSEGIVRKEKPVYRMPEAGNGLDFRTHHFSPSKPFLGRLFPTEVFNIFIVWIFSLLTFWALRARLLRKLLQIRD